MIHRMTVLSNPRLLLYFVILIGLPASGAASFSYFPPLVAAAALGIGLFLSYRLYRFASPYLGTGIQTDENGITFTLPGEGELSFSWQEIDLSGRCTQTRGKSFLFTYNAKKDRLISIPYEYTGMKDLQTVLEEKTPFEIFHFLPGMSLRGVLQERYPENIKKK